MKGRYPALLFPTKLFPPIMIFPSALAIRPWVSEDELISVFLIDLQTAISALWLLYNLARHPEVQENLYQEVTSVIGKDGDVLPGSLAKLSYLKACVKESARRVLCINSLFCFLFLLLLLLLFLFFCKRASGEQLS